jgi:hypothetical protein
VKTSDPNTQVATDQKPTRVKTSDNNTQVSEEPQPPSLSASFNKNVKVGSPDKKKCKTTDIHIQEYRATPIERKYLELNQTTILEDPELQKYVDQADLTSNETIKKNQTMDTTMRENYEIERYAKIINLLKIDMIAKQDSEKSTRKKYNKILKAFNLMKKENDDVRQSFFAKEQNFHKIINQLNQDLVKAKNCLAEYISLSEWINICGSETMKDKCVHEIERIRRERCRAFEAKSANYLNRDSFMLDETLGGSGTFSPKNEILDNPDGAKYQSHVVNAKKVKVNRTYDSNQNVYRRKESQNSQELVRQPNYPSFNTLHQTVTGDMFKKKTQQAGQTEGSIDLGHWGKDPGMDGDNLGVGLMADSQRTLAERQGQFESCLPSYPSLKSLDGDELEYFKHKCTALIYRNEELREELQNSKGNLELIKAQVD